jgi:hypothetical protein
MRRSFEHSFKITQQGASLNQIPVIALQSLASDLTVIEVEGSYYFKASVGSNILIAGYDFPAGWVKGWPLKSNANVDIFGLTAVPVISLLNSNFDYGNQFFTKQVDQVVDGNGVETSEGYLSAIVAYSTPLTDANLTAANTYFNTPTELTAAVRYDDYTNGLDAQAGTKLLPWKTIQKANISATAADTIYVKTGANVEGAYLDLSKLLNIKSIGKTIVKVTGTNQIIYFNAGNANITALILDAENAKNGVVVNTGSAKTNVITSCKIINSSLRAVNVNSATCFTDLVKCVIIGQLTAVQALQLINTSGLIDSCYFANDTLAITPKDSIIKNNRWYDNDKPTCISSANSAIEVYGNKFKFKKSAIIESAAFTTEKVINIHDNYFFQDTYLQDAKAVYFTVKVNATVKNNKIVNTRASIGAGVYLIQLGTTTDESLIKEVDNNIILSSATTYVHHILVYGNGAKIRNNYSHSNSLIGITISLGIEGLPTGLNDSAVITGNRSIGSAYSNPSNSTLLHGIFANNGINIKTAYNYSSHNNPGIVIKTGTQQAYTSEGVYGNLVVDCVSGIWARGVSALKIYSNTVIHSDTAYGVEFNSCFIADKNIANAGDQFCENVLIINNIAISLRNAGTLILFDDHAAANGCTADYNIYYSPVAKPFRIGATYYSFVEWQGLGYDAHSIMLTSAAQAKALFTDFDNGDYSLAVGSAAIGAGATLAGYTTLLDSTSTWGSETTTPVIVTKENTSVCVGAYTR